MLSNIIKFDLHIHSIASDYKEPKYKNGLSIVHSSTKKNIGILLDNLIKNEITLFSITDHNRYNYDLYKDILIQLKTDKYNSIKLLHGVEFDVILEKNKPETHIIVIFDVTSDEDMVKIKKAIDNNLLIGKNDSYDKNSFEDLLRSISLDTILIAHQRCNLDNSVGRHKSLSEGVKDPYQIIQIGYVTALEYQKPNVEGIIKNNLKKIDSMIPLITGSDCHDWRVYPSHDKENIEQNKYFSKIKSLPSFKGLLFALTSPKTRFNRNESLNTNYIDSFSINGKKILLDPGINVIIGENGSGKSTLFNILENKRDLKSYIKTLKKENNITSNLKSLNIKSIEQAELVKKYQSNELFYDDTSLFNEISTEDFDNKYSLFSKTLKKYIDQRINKYDALTSLENKNFEINEKYVGSSTLYVIVTSDGLNTIENSHKEHREKIANILSSLYEEYLSDYYDSKEHKQLYESIIILKNLYNKLCDRENKLEKDNKIKNIIIKECINYSSRIQELSTSEDSEISNYNICKSKFISEILNVMILKGKTLLEIKLPKLSVGESRNRKNGYVFTKETAYNRIDAKDKFFEFMFISDYRSLDKVKSIKTKEEFVKAINGCTSEEKIDVVWNANYEKFCKWAKKERLYIKEESSEDSIGNTLGEMSLVYYKFQTSVDKPCDVLMIDQPEDNISNNRIADKLLTYLDSVRQNKQLIIVTHNPLLVVNLDVDNVIHLTKTNNHIEIKSGCLEDEKNNIIKLVAKTLDGGKDMIEKRLKIYGKNC